MVRSPVARHTPTPVLRSGWTSKKVPSAWKTV
jgi:hypothetical protein